MDDIIQNDKNFKQAIGEFIIAFSQLEFGLVFLCIMTEFDLRKRNESLNKYLALSFDKKVKHLDDYIKENLTELNIIWEKLHLEIKKLNNERRFLVHGFISNSLPKDNISTMVKVNGKLASKNQSLSEIKDFINRLHHLNTGENGINGEFNILLTKTRIDKWNELVSDDNKIVYNVNGEKLTKWKGK